MLHFAISVLVVAELDIVYKFDRQSYIKTIEMQMIIEIIYMNVDF